MKRTGVKCLLNSVFVCVLIPYFQVRAWIYLLSSRCVPAAYKEWGMLSDLIRVFLVATLTGLVPGYFWARCLVLSEDRGVRLASSVALSLALVPVVALGLARLLGGGVTVPISIVSPLVVLGIGIGIYALFGPGKDADETLARTSGPPGALTLAFITGAVALVLVSIFENLPAFRLAGECMGWPDVYCLGSGAAQKFIIPITLVLVSAGILHFFSYRRHAAPVSSSQLETPENGSRMVTGVGRRLLLPAVLALVLVRGYLGTVIHDWPYIRGLDNYSHAVMTDMILERGTDSSYLIYPPGFHTMTGVISRLTGLEPLKIFPVLGPALLLLPALSCYVLARRLWGWQYGVAAAFFSGALMGGSYYYFNDAMYPNIIASQFLLILTVAALIQLYSTPSIRTAALMTLLGSAIVFYHQVSSLYLALLLAFVGAGALPYLLLRDRRKGLVLLASMVLLTALAVVYAWDTYNLPRAIASLIGSENGRTGAAVGMVLGTQIPYNLDYMIVAIVSQPVAWLGLLGLVFFAANRGGWTRPPEALTRLTLLAWAVLIFAGSRTSYSGFPQRFGRDLGIPLSLFAALALVLILQSLLKYRRSATLAIALLAVLSIGMLVGLREVVGFEQAIGPSRHLTMTPQISAAGKWLANHNTGGNIMVSPQGNQVPSRMMLAMGHYTAYQSFTEQQLLYPRDLPPSVGPLRDTLWVMNNPTGEKTRRILEQRDVRYIVTYKYMPDRPVIPYWQLFIGWPDLYPIAFENQDVVVFKTPVTTSAG